MPEYAIAIKRISTVDRIKVTADKIQWTTDWLYLQQQDNTVVAVVPRKALVYVADVDHLGGGKTS